jgi:hypothetical protein
MAIVFDAASIDASSSTGSPFTWSHTITTSDSHRILIVLCIGQDTSITLSNVTYGGNALTALSGSRVNNGGFQEWFYLANPPTGSNTISVSASGGFHFTGMAVSYTGVDTANPFGVPQTDSGAGVDSTMTANITAVNTSLVISCGMQRDRNTLVDPPNPTSGFGITERANEWSNSGTGTQCTAGSLGDQAGEASTNVSYDKQSGANEQGTLVAAELKIASSGRTRIVKYLHNTYMSRKAGRPVILDVLGRDVPLEQIEFDNWISTDGPFFPTAKKYASTVEDPATAYIEGLRIRGERATIETVKEAMFVSILNRLSRSA